MEYCAVLSMSLMLSQMPVSSLHTDQTACTEMLVYILAVPWPLVCTVMNSDYSHRTIGWREWSTVWLCSCGACLEI